MANVLIIDDEKQLCELMSRAIDRLGHHVEFALTLEQGLKLAQLNDVDIVFLDVQLPDGNGLKRLPAFLAVPSSPEVIIVTGFADPDGAQLAMECNAWDYLQKPASVDQLRLVVERALRYRKQRQAGEPKFSLKKHGIIGDSPEIKACLDIAARGAASNVNVLISGQTGTGKELFARAIHANSSRADHHFVVVDCGALPESIIENLLFGHTRGAFTDAHRAEEGFIKHADGGTLFLDEVGELTLPMQKTFLRVLQERRFNPIGQTREIESNFRLVAASNRDLDEMTARGQFRNDLLFRLRSIAIHLPLLHERVGDIKDLSIHHVRRLCESHAIEIKNISPDFFDVLKTYSWPGNVRELYSTLEWTFTQAFYEETLFPKHLPTQLRIQAARSGLNDTAAEKQQHSGSSITPSAIPRWQEFRKTHIARGEMQYLHDLIGLAGGNITRAAELSGISRPHLYGLIRKYNLSA
jgi:two-component system NtrC family response regulator